MRVGRGIVLVVGLVVSVVAAVAMLARPGGPKGAALALRESTMMALGTRIATTCQDCKVLVLSNPFSKDAGLLDEKRQFEQAAVRGLRKGLGGRSSVKVVFPGIRPEYFSNPQSVFIPPDSRTPLSFLMRADSVDELAAENPECRVIVSLIGLPSETDRLKVWGESDPRSFALLLPDLRLLGPPAKAAEAFLRGKLLAAVAEERPPSTGPLMVGRDNVLEILEHQPKALGY